MTLNIDAQLQNLIAQFKSRFGRAPEFAAVAPGRVNLIGEHTDYNDGFVLPMAIERQTVIVAARSNDPGSRNIRIATTTLQPAGQEIAEFTADQSLAPGQPKWANYVKGAIAGCINKGLVPDGFDALIDSTVPLGGGLSSSASLEVATATLIEQITGKTLWGVDKALLCQAAEHKFAGVPCGVMDQFISAMGQQDHAMLLDCRTYHPEHVPFNDPGVSVLIANTNVKHELTGGEYAQRRAECERAAKSLGLASLRDANEELLLSHAHKLDKLAFRRARHVIGEIARTTHAAKAAKTGSWTAFGAYMLESHVSLRDDFEVSCSELDIMVDLARERIFSGDVYGSRMTGGGFGGCTVTLVRTEAIERVTNHLLAGYAKATGVTATIFATRPAQGARGLKV